MQKKYRLVSSLAALLGRSAPATTGAPRTIEAPEKAYMRLKGKLGILLASILTLVFAFVEISHRVSFGHFASPGLHADVLTREANNGIPGTAFEARLTNFGVLPVRITVCDFVSDIGLTLELVGSRLEEWDPLGNQWRSLFIRNDASSCHPVPPAMAETHVVSRVETHVVRREL